MSCGHYDPQPAGFISQTDDECVSARVSAGLLSVLCTDSIIWSFLSICLFLPGKLTILTILTIYIYIKTEQVCHDG